MRTRLLHLADLHLGEEHAFLGDRSRARREETDALLTRIVDSVLLPDSRVGGVLIAGDLFDTHEPPAFLVRSVLEDLRRLEQAGVRVLTVPGNHDEFSYPGCVYRREAARWPGILVTAPECRKVASWDLAGTPVDLYAMAFVAGRSRPPFDGFPVEPGRARKIAILHGSLDANWSDRSLPLSSERLARLDLDYVALGHIHRPVEKRVGRSWAVYPGRIEGAGFEDPGGAGLCEVELGDGEPAVFRVPWPSRRHDDLEWNISSLSQPAQLEEKIRNEEDPERILRLRLSGMPAFAVDPLELAARHARRFYHLEITAEDTLPHADGEQIALERTMRGAFARVALRAIEEAGNEEERELRRGALRLGLAAFERGTGR